MRVIPPDMEAWLTGYVRAAAQHDEVTVDVTNKEPPGLTVKPTKPLIVIRDDSGPQTGPTTFQRSIGASVLAGTRLDDKPVNDLARWLAALLFDQDLPLVDGSPIAAVIMGGCNGPYSVAEQADIARRYLTAQYIVTGSWGAEKGDSDGEPTD